MIKDGVFFKDHEGPITLQDLKDMKEYYMTTKFTKDGKVVAVLKDSASEPDGIEYVSDVITVTDSVVPADVAVADVEPLPEDKE